MVYFLHFVGALGILAGVMILVSPPAQIGLALGVMTGAVLIMGFGRLLHDVSKIRAVLERGERAAIPKPQVEAHPPQPPAPPESDPPHPGTAFTRAVTGLRPPPNAVS